MKIHGFHSLAPGYALAHVPRDAVVFPLTSPLTIPKSCTISTNYSVAKAVVAIIQLSIACTTLGRNASTEIADNGYGSYNLTVLQYAMMSLLNLIGITVNPTYPALFLVSSEVMGEAVQRGSLFDGVVGRLEPASIELGGVENNKIGGKFRVASLNKTTRVLPDGWERQVHPSGKTYFLSGVQKRATWTDPSIEVVVDTMMPTYYFRPDGTADDEIMAQMATMLKKLNRSAVQKVVAHSNTANKSASALSEFEIVPTAKTSSSTWKPDCADNPTLFVPCCPCFKRKNASSYAVHYDRIWQNPMGTVHFIGRDANRRRLTAAFLTQYGSMLLAATTIAIIGAITRFKPGQSTIVSRVIFMPWLGVGIFKGSGAHNVLWNVRVARGDLVLLAMMGLLEFCIPAGLGFYEVARVMQRYAHTSGCDAADITRKFCAQLGSNSFEPVASFQCVRYQLWQSVSTRQWLGQVDGKHSQTFHCGTRSSAGSKRSLVVSIATSTADISSLFQIINPWHLRIYDDVCILHITIRLSIRERSHCEAGTSTIGSRKRSFPSATELPRPSSVFLSANVRHC